MIRFRALIPPYVELRVKTAFSVLRGTLLSEELLWRAAKLGMRRMAIVDDDGLNGVVRGHAAGRKMGVEILIGLEVHLFGSARLRRDRSPRAPGSVLLATDRAHEGWLGCLLTVGRTRTGQGGFQITFDDVVRHREGLYAIHTGLADTFSLAREKELFEDGLALSKSFWGPAGTFGRANVDSFGPDSYRVRPVGGRSLLGCSLVMMGVDACPNETYAGHLVVHSVGDAHRRSGLATLGEPECLSSRP